MLGSEPYVESYVRVDIPFKELAFAVAKGGIHRQHDSIDSTAQEGIKSLLNDRPAIISGL